MSEGNKASTTSTNPKCTCTTTAERRKHFSVLMREHHQELLVFGSAIVRDHQAAQDIVQDSLVAAWKKFGDFDEDRDFGAWMRGIVRNKSKDWFRKTNRQPVSDLDIVEMEIDLTAWQSARAAGAGIFEAIEVCLGHLPDNLRGAVDAFYFEDQDGKDAAETLKISPANLRKRLERARGLLHDCLIKKTEISEVRVISASGEPDPGTSGAATPRFAL